MLKTRSHLWVAMAVVALLGSAGPALAGPPLICHPFETGAVPLLSWGQGNGWNSPDTKYDLHRLTADTVRLLNKDAAVLARMENLRRATIYAMKDPQVAQELLAALVSRALSPSGPQDSERVVRCRLSHRSVPAGGSSASAGERARRLGRRRRIAESGRLRLRQEGHHPHTERRHGVCRIIDDARRRGVRASRPRGSGRNPRLAACSEPVEILSRSTRARGHRDTETQRRPFWGIPNTKAA